MIAIRPLSKLDELVEAVRLQKQIWGFEDADLLPLRFFVVATKVGGQVFGAFDGTDMVGFLIAIPGVKSDGSPYFHSHMMGVLEGYRNQGAGKQLKLNQRQDALARGIKLIEWTFDPLELKNAFFNIERLGAVIRRYVLNQYGTTTSALHGGLPTDRCIAEWHVASERVEAILEGRAIHRSPAARIEVPSHIASIRKSDPEAARAIQRQIGEQFQAELERGLAVTGFESGKDRSTYLLEPWPSE